VVNVGKLLQICPKAMKMKQLSLQAQNMTETKRLGQFKNCADPLCFSHEEAYGVSRRVTTFH
jgi:hypothetical protein